MNQTNATSSQQDYLNPTTDYTSGMPDIIQNRDTSLELRQVVVRNLHLYFAPSVSPVGLVFNLLSIGILAKPKLSGFCSSQYVIGILVADSLYLVWIFHRWLVVRDVPVYTVGALCHFEVFTKGVLELLSVWLTVAMCIDHFLVMLFPVAHARLCSTCVARMVIVTLTIVATVVYLNTSLLYSVMSYNGRTICTTNPAYEHVLYVLHTIDIFVNSGIALLLILLLLAISFCPAVTRHRNFGIHRGLQLHHDRLGGRLTPGSTPPGYDETAVRMQSQASAALIVSFILFSGPVRLYRLQDTAHSLLNPNAEPSLHSFLITEILQYASHVRLAADLGLLMAFNQAFRTIFCRGLAKCMTPRLLFRARTDSLILCGTQGVRLRRNNASTTQFMEYDLWMNPRQDGPGTGDCPQPQQL